MLYPVELQAPYFHKGNRSISKAYNSLAIKLVGVERFELPTSCTQSRRATRLRYTPIDRLRDDTLNRATFNVQNAIPIRKSVGHFL